MQSLVNKLLPALRVLIGSYNGDIVVFRAIGEIAVWGFLSRVIIVKYAIQTYLRFAKVRVRWVVGL